MNAVTQDHDSMELEKVYGRERGIVFFDTNSYEGDAWLSEDKTKLIVSNYYTCFLVDLTALGLKVIEIGKQEA